MTDLQELRTKLSVMRSDLQCGPLLVADTVLSWNEIWSERYRGETGKSFDSWLVEEMGNSRMGVSFFRRRALAKAQLGSEITKTIDHEVAIWIVNKVPRIYWEPAKKELIRQFFQHKKKPLTPGQARPLVQKMIGHTPVTRGSCANCQRLENELEKLKRQEVMKQIVDE